MTWIMCLVHMAVLQSAFGFLGLHRLCLLFPTFPRPRNPADDDGDEHIQHLVKHLGRPGPHLDHRKHTSIVYSNQTFPPQRYLLPFIPTREQPLSGPFRFSPKGGANYVQATVCPTCCRHRLPYLVVYREASDQAPERGRYSHHSFFVGLGIQANPQPDLLPKKSCEHKTSNKYVLKKGVLLTSCS